jgi:hypothetical protein
MSAPPRHWQEVVLDLSEITAFDQALVGCWDHLSPEAQAAAVRLQELYRRRLAPALRQELVRGLERERAYGRAA